MFAEEQPALSPLPLEPFRYDLVRRLDPYLRAFDAEQGSYLGVGL